MTPKAALVYGALIVIAAVLFQLTVTACYGFNMAPTCYREAVCDLVARSFLWIGALVMVVGVVSAIEVHSTKKK